MAEAQTDPVAGLVDIPLPPAVSLLPQTWPLRIAVVVLAAGLIAGLCWLAYRWIRNRYRREALAELARIEKAIGGSAPARTSAALASLVRRTALAAFPRGQIAGLTGPAWLDFLDRTSDSRGFSEGAGRSLEIGAYQPGLVDVRTLVVVVRHWIRTHHD